MGKSTLRLPSRHIRSSPRPASGVYSTKRPSIVFAIRTVEGKRPGNADEAATALQISTCGAVR
eukprot:scaffold1141_cov333-Pavlova_lutheri.AAC.7